MDTVKGILYQNIGILPTTATLPLPLWSIQPPEFSAFDHNILTTNELNKLPPYAPNVYPFDPTTIYSTVKTPSDAVDASLFGYYHNGRFLKQYFVAEDNFDDLNGLNNYLRYMPYVPSNFNIPAASKQPNLGFPSFSTAPSTLQQNLPFSNLYSPFPRTLSKPTQLGSGSLGFIRLANGAVYLGSGSLGFVNNEQKANELNEVRNRQSPQAGPLTFGETPQ